MTSGIPSARRKLARARHHADQLREEVETFRERSPYDFETKSLGNPRGQSDFRVLVKVSESEPIPESWSLMFGDVLTNARAALDHAIFHHVRAQSPAIPPHRIQYPIFDDPQTFATRTSGRFSPAVHQLIEAAQPYKSPDPSGHPLRLLRDLVNIDKHHEVVVTNYAAEALEFKTHEMYEVVSPPQVNQVAMEPGATVARAHLRLVKKVVGDRLVQVPLTIVYGEMIDIPGRPGRDGLLRTFECILAVLGPHLDELEAAGC